MFRNSYLSARGNSVGLPENGFNVVLDRARRRKPRGARLHDVLQRAAQRRQPIGLADEVGMQRDAHHQRLGIALAQQGGDLGHAWDRSPADRQIEFPAATYHPAPIAASWQDHAHDPIHEPTRYAVTTPMATWTLSFGSEVPSHSHCLLTDMRAILWILACLDDLFMRASSKRAFPPWSGSCRAMSGADKENDVRDNKRSRCDSEHNLRSPASRQGMRKLGDGALSAKRSMYPSALTEASVGDYDSSMSV